LQDKGSLASNAGETDGTGHVVPRKGLTSAENGRDSCVSVQANRKNLVPKEMIDTSECSVEALVNQEGQGLFSTCWGGVKIGQWSSYHVIKSSIGKIYSLIRALFFQ